MMAAIKVYSHESKSPFARIGSFVLLKSLLGLPKHVVATHESKK
jgi:hypothetical protein